MLPLTTTTVLLASLGLACGLAVDANAQVGGHGTKTKCKPPASTCIAPDALQTASRFTGLEEGTPGIRPGLSESAT
jgi:hypothetical protein